MVADGSTIALKVDVDTFEGTRDGVPNLVELFREFGVKATFYFSLGPDNSGKAVRRIFTKKGFLQKMLRTKAPSVYGPRTLLYGTLLPAPLIGERCGDVVRLAQAAGHETGIHCWDHVKWHDYLPRMSREQAADELAKAAEAFRGITGRNAETTAAPGWTVSSHSLDIQDGMALLYCSDGRGKAPFFPVFGGKRYATLQIPTTLPTMDELLGENGVTAATVNDHYLRLIGPGLTVHTIHAELEGKALFSVFRDLLARLVATGARFVTLGEAARETLASSPPESVMAMGELPGRAGLVALQR